MNLDYRSVCNMATLQSEKRGFFLSLADMIENEAGPDWIESFKLLPSDKARIEACLTDPKVCDIVHGMLSKVQKIFRGKAGNFAKSKMEEGEHWLRKGKLERALASANLAVVRAPLKGAGIKDCDLKIAPLSLWIRSEILFEMSEFEYSLNDIQLALKYNLQSDLKPAAYLRMGKCYLNLGDKKKCIVSLKIAMNCGGDSIKEESNKILMNVDSLLKKQPQKQVPFALPESSTDLPGLTKSVILCKDEKCGRFIKANAPISVGDYVACEEPYSSVLYIEKHGTHCLHCFSRLKAPIPCSDCSGVGFCSNDCLNKGMVYHKWECPYLELHIGSGMSILSHLALRVVTQRNLDYFKKAKCKGHEYQRVLDLEGHQKQRDGQDMFRRTLMSLFLLQSLRHGGYFDSPNMQGKSTSEDYTNIDKLTPDELQITCLLLHNLQVLQYNAHEIYETVIPQDNTKNHGITLYIGLGLYLSASMMNHQCQPTLARYFQGRNLVLRAQHPINIGDNVTENYGPVFTMRTRDQRQKVLTGRYLFLCNCKACNCDWPMLTNMDPSTAYFKCKQPSCQGSVLENGTCCDCGETQSFDDEKLLWTSYQEDWDNAAKMLSTHTFREAEKTLVEYVNNMWALVNQPNKNLCLAMEALRTIWANTTGNVAYLPVEAKKSVSS